MREIVPDSTL